MILIFKHKRMRINSFNLKLENPNTSKINQADKNENTFQNRKMNIKYLKLIFSEGMAK